MKLQSKRSHPNHCDHGDCALPSKEVRQQTHARNRDLKNRTLTAKSCSIGEGCVSPPYVSVPLAFPLVPFLLAHHRLFFLSLACGSDLRRGYGLGSDARIYQQYAAEHGDVNAQIKLAEEYYWGNNVPRDYARVGRTPARVYLQGRMDDGAYECLRALAAMRYRSCFSP